MTLPLLVFVLLLSSAVLAQSDTVKLYDGSIQPKEFKRYLTAYGFDESGTDSVRLDAWQGECYFTIVTDSHATSWGSRGTLNWQWSFELGAEPTYPANDTMHWTFTINSDDVTYMINRDRWSQACDSTEWNVVVLHAKHREAGVGCWNWYQADDDYYEYENGVVVQLLRPMFIENDNDTSWGTLFIDGANDSLTITIDTLFCDTADYPVTVEINTLNHVAGVCTDGDIFYGYPMDGDGQAGPYVIFKGTNSSTLYQYHFYSAFDDGNLDSIEVGLFSSNNSAAGSYDDTIAVSALALTGRADLEQSSTRSAPSLITIGSDDSYTLSNNTVYWPSAGGIDWNMYNHFNNQQAAGACDTCVKSKFQNGTAPPLDDPVDDGVLYENKGWFIWCTYYEPGYSPTGEVEVTNGTMTGVTIE